MWSMVAAYGLTKQGNAGGGGEHNPPPPELIVNCHQAVALPAP